MGQTGRRTTRRGSALAVVVAAATLLGGCTGDDEGSPRADSASAAPQAGVETTVSYGAVTGRLPRPARDRLGADVRAVVDGWLDAAYVGGDYPRSDFDSSWPGFTAGARERARRDAALMSNADLGPRIDGVEAERRSVKLDVLAVRGRPVGVTARVVLRFATTGESAGDVRVAARLYLTEAGDGWRVFGYDVTKEAL